MISIKKNYMDFLAGEIENWLDNKIISDEQAENILGLYEIKQRSLKFILLISGLILMGLGGISFIGAHWFEIPKIIRVCVIVASYIISVGIYFYLGASESKAGRAFLLLGSLIIGAGIFLITRMYNYKLTQTSGTGWWLIGIFIVTLIFRDVWQLYLLEILSFFYLFFSGAIDFFALQFIMVSRTSILSFFEPLEGFVLLAALYLICRYMNDKVANNAAMFLALMVLASRMTLCFGGTVSLIILVILGSVLSFITKWHEVSSFGLLMAGMLGLLLTWPEFWRGEFFRNQIMGFPGTSFFSVLTAVLLAPVMIFQIYKGRILAGGAFFVLLTARYFFDRIFGYMPKAWGFTIIGIIFLISGFLIERRSKKKESQKEFFEEEEFEELKK